jgi:cbb3-type cytochrome oxidase subunit 3
MGKFLNLIIFTIFLTVCWLLELIVVNEEVLLMLCFLAFVFNLYITYKQSIYDGLNQKSVTLKEELLESLRAQDSAILTRLSSTGSWSDKVTAGFRLSSSALFASFTYQLLEKRAFFVAALMDALNSLYILWSRALEDKLLVLRQKIVSLSSR